MLDQTILAEIRRLVQQELPAAVSLRHHIHAHPELTWQEERTAATVTEHLRAIPGMEVTEGVGRLGVVGLLQGDSPGPVIGLRADMDALPIEETTPGIDYRSRHKGVMHACGHDGHTANLMGAARILGAMRSRLKGAVKFIFQPAEEGGGGADVMCRDGVLENPDVDMIFGMHGWPEAPCGQIWVKDGPLMAANSGLQIAVEGTGCHAAFPHLGTDQVLVAARIVDGLQAVISRVRPPVEPACLTIATIHGGTADNVIPARVELTGTLRTVTEPTRDRLEAAIRQVAGSIADAHGARAQVRIEHNYPVTRNHRAPTDWLEQVAVHTLGRDGVHRLADPVLGAEDFSYYLQRIPGSFFFLGMNPDPAGSYPSLHNCNYNFNDAALPRSMELFAALGLCRQSLPGKEGADRPPSA